VENLKQWNEKKNKPVLNESDNNDTIDFQNTLTCLLFFFFQNNDSHNARNYLLFNDIDIMLNIDVNYEFISIVPTNDE